MNDKGAARAGRAAEACNGPTENSASSLREHVERSPRLTLEPVVELLDAFPQDQRAVRRRIDSLQTTEVAAAVADRALIDQEVVSALSKR